MELSVWSAFFAASLVLAFAPGPDNLFVLVQSAALGARAGLWVVAGLLTGIVLQTLAAALGIAAVVAASPALFWGIPPARRPPAAGVPRRRVFSFVCLRILPNT